MQSTITYLKLLSRDLATQTLALLGEKKEKDKGVGGNKNYSLICDKPTVWSASAHPTDAIGLEIP